MPPRNSILHLFDPLASPPHDSDKENSNSSIIPLNFTRRLVDVGDVTVQEDTSLRIPLADILLELDATPVARSKSYKHSPPPSSLPRSAILSVITEVNSLGTSFASPSPRSRLLSLPPDTTLQEESLSIPAPHIIISSADPLSSSVATLNLDPPTGTLITDTARPFDNTPPEDSHLPRLRPCLPSTSSRDPNRHSIDLYSSFQLQLQSEETSFDLLNDRISFFAPGNDAESFFGDDSFDMAVEESNMEKALEKIKSEEKAVKPKSPSPATAHPLPHVGSPLAGASDAQLNITPNSTPDTRASDTAARDSERKVIPNRHSLGSSPSPKLPSPLTRSTTSFGSPSAIPVFVSPPLQAASHTSLHTPRPSDRDAFVKPLPAVPALKIVKRAKRFDHEKPSYSGSTSSSSSPSILELFGPAQTAVSTALKGQRLGFIAASAVVPARIAGPSRGEAGAPVSTSASANKMSTGPRRVPVTQGYGSAVTNKSFSGTQKAPPVVGMIGPKRVPVVAAPKMSTQVKVPVASGLKPPSRYGGGSALPRPIMASKMGTGEVNGNGGARNLGVRRMIFGGK